MSKLSLSNMVKATGLAAIIAAASACGMPGQRVPPAPYIVAPGHANWNLGAGFMNVAGGMPAPNTNGRGERREITTLDFGNATYHGEVIFENGKYFPHGYGIGKWKDGSGTSEGYWERGKYLGKEIGMQK